MRKTAFLLQSVREQIQNKANNHILSPAVIRSAFIQDAAGIIACNRRNLPENYKPEFFIEQITTWKDLSIVAENENSSIVGYALASLSYPHEGSESIHAHIISVAVDRAYRRKGLAVNLMKDLHQRIVCHGDVSQIHLYCRVTNHAAVNLYQKYFEYRIANIIPSYYDDDESAYLMELEPRANN